jgi:hypothetical protein
MAFKLIEAAQSRWQALVAAFAADKAVVDESSTRTAIAEATAD